MRISEIATKDKDICTILYSNLNSIRAALDLFNCIGEDMEAAIYCCSEPIQGMAKGKEEWTVDERIDTALWTNDEGHYTFGSGKGFVWVEYRGLAVYSRDQYEETNG